MTSAAQRYRDADTRLRSLALRDSGWFAQYVLRDERTGKQVLNAPVHWEWHRLAAQHPWLVIWASVEAGKTQQLGVAYLLHALGRDTSRRIAVVSETKGIATKTTRVAKRYIDHSHELRAVFPDLLPGRPWQDDAFTVTRDVRSRDFSVEAVGMDGHILSARFDLVIIDDLVTLATTRTEYQRHKTLDWIDSTLLGRLTADSQVILLSNAWEVDDPAHELAKRPGWYAVRSPVWNEQTGALAWPARWPLERIAEWRRKHGEAEYERQLMCKPRPRGAGRFRREWIDLGLGLGEGAPVCRRWEDLPDEEQLPGAGVVIGVDLAVKGKAHNDETAFFGILSQPDGRRRALFCEAGKGEGWTGPDVIEHIVSLWLRFRGCPGGVRFFVEDVAAQHFIVQFARARFENLRSTYSELRDLNIDRLVEPYTTHSGKSHPEYGVEGIATELSVGRWIIPSRRNADGELTAACPQLVRWINECLLYDPSAHTGDRLMASWFARQGADAGRFRYEVTTLGEIPPEVRERYEAIRHSLTERRRIGVGVTEEQMVEARKSALWDDLGEAVDLEGTDVMLAEALREEPAWDLDDLL